MNIRDAKEQIKNAITTYFAKDRYGNYYIPAVGQRPVFLMGPPGIGKTAIMEQIAQELGVGLVSYSMTHHTRQSALGLPFIVKKTYKGREYDVSEYTMSEIIASVYDLMEETGISEGILFLDEINCVSETLVPSMLQFLQYKIFGRHRIPEGWIVVTAGNPPEYNKSVREFDIVTWDRLKRIDVEPDFDAWKDYAYEKGTHPSIMTYLEIKRDHFYKVETTVSGADFVTARGWDDLSQMIELYEKKGLIVDDKLISQYLQNRTIAREYAIYYDLFNKYKSSYQIEDILSGKTSEEIENRAKAAAFDERLSLMGLLLDTMMDEFKQVVNTESLLIETRELLKDLENKLLQPGADPMELLSNAIRIQQHLVETKRKAANLSKEEQQARMEKIGILENLKAKMAGAKNHEQAFSIIKSDFNSRVKAMEAHAEQTGEKLANLFKFCEEVFGSGQELLILVTELTIGSYSAKFISRYGSEAYFSHNKELLFYERKRNIIEELGRVDQ